MVWLSSILLSCLQAEICDSGGSTFIEVVSKNNFFRELLLSCSFPKGCLGPALDPLPSTKPVAVLQALKVSSVL